MSGFTGTTAYYKISRRDLLTDGTKHLAEKGACFWMQDSRNCLGNTKTAAQNPLGAIPFRPRTAVCWRRTVVPITELEHDELDCLWITFARNFSPMISTLKT